MKNIPRAKDDSDVLMGWEVDYEFLEKIQAEIDECEHGQTALELIECAIIALSQLGYCEIEPAPRR